MNNLLWVFVFIAIYVIGVLISYVITKIAFREMDKTSPPQLSTRAATEEYVLGLLTVLSFFGIFCLLISLVASIAFKYLDKKFNLNK